MSISVSHLRNAVERTLEDEQATSIDYLNAAKVSLVKWSMEKLRDHIITAMMSIGGKAYLASQVTGNINYTSQVSEAEKDTWLAANSDRVLFGAAKSNNQANDHSASLAMIDNSADKFSPTILGIAKRMATSATPAISPVTVMDEREMFVCFCNTNAFRDFSDDSTMTQANREAQLRGKSNPLFTDGDLVWKNVVVREIPEIPSLGAVGAAGINVGVNFLCGAQSVGLAWAKQTAPIMMNKDYEFTKGVGVMEMRGVMKLLFEDPDNLGSDVDHGIVTIYTASVDDV
jgi:hypothetical protein